ncbi:Hsp20/alpha crystallin family protein [Hwanghaeella sp.]|uniref:Hsp20/alpha crystallin family protein n=1 Tax=Hwanghaeella sp. TaxID=2605943 RepID=UPI003CCB83AC
MSKVNITKGPGPTFDRGDHFWPAIFDPLRQFGASVAHLFSPSAEASQQDGKYTISIELPGVKVEEIDVSVDDNVLTVKGEKKSEREEKDEDRHIYFCERTFGSFQRSFRLPSDVDPARIDAGFVDGVLTVSLPKRPEKETSRTKIDVKSA